MRTLVVDDEKNIRRTMAMALESMDHEAVSVASGAEAFKELIAQEKKAGLRP